MAQPQVLTPDAQLLAANAWIEAVRNATHVDLEIRHARGDRIAANVGRPFVAIQDGGIICWLDEFPLSVKQRINANKKINQFKLDCAKLAASGI